PKPCSPVSQLVEPLLVDAEVVGELVEDRDPDLPLESRRVLAVCLEQWLPVDRDPCRQVFGLVEQTVEVGLRGIPLLDHDGDVLEPPGKLRRERVERGANVLLELAHQGTIAASNAFSECSRFSASSQAAQRGP